MELQFQGYEHYFRFIKFIIMLIHIDLPLIDSLLASLKISEVIIEPTVAPFIGDIYNTHFAFMWVLRVGRAPPSITGVSGAQTFLFSAPNRRGSDSGNWEWWQRIQNGLFRWITICCLASLDSSPFLSLFLKSFVMREPSNKLNKIHFCLISRSDPVACHQKLWVSI